MIFGSIEEATTIIQHSEYTLNQWKCLTIVTLVLWDVFISIFIVVGALNDQGGGPRYTETRIRMTLSKDFWS